VWVDFFNTGKAGAAFYVYNGCKPDAPPRRYTVSSSQQLSDYWEPAAEQTAYDLSTYGRNGYLACFRGTASWLARPEASVRYDRSSGDVYLVLANPGTEPCTLTAINSYANGEIRHYELAAGATSEDRWPLVASSGWFDLSIAGIGNAFFLRRFAGHAETDRPGTSDPGHQI